MRIPPVSLPIFDHQDAKHIDGGLVELCRFCLSRMASEDQKCIDHYRRMRDAGRGFYICPYGFTTYPLRFGVRRFTITGIVATPRFGDSKEMERAKSFPSVRVTRQAVLSLERFLAEVAEDIELHEDQARKRLPQALHELRKLNAIVKANAEDLGGSDSSDRMVKDIAGSAELMSNIFDVIEALANIDGLKSVKLDEFVAVYDLAFKAKKIYQGRARLKPVHISVNGDDSVAISGSKKTFPLVFTVLLENAIKYSEVGSQIDVLIGRQESNCTIEVRNKSDNPIDPLTCFDLGTRFGVGSEDGDGLGLYLAKEIVHSHGGSISCSASEKEVTMRVVLPAHKHQVRKKIAA